LGQLICRQISGLDWRISDVSSEIRAGSFLFQQFSVLIYRFNAVFLHYSFTDVVAGCRVPVESIL